MDLLKGVRTEIRTERGIAIALLSSFLAGIYRGNPRGGGGSAMVRAHMGVGGTKS
jgi:hypothetical protein